MAQPTSTEKIPPRAVIVITRLEDPTMASMVECHSNRGIVRRRGIGLDLLTDPAKLLRICTAVFDGTGAGEGTLIVDRVPVYLWDDGDDKGQLREFVFAAERAGWRAGAGIELGSGWVTLQAEGAPVIHLGVRRMMDDPMIGPLDSPDVIAERLGRYALLIGGAYHATPGVSGIGALRNWYRRPRVIKEPGKPERLGKRPAPTWHWTVSNPALHTKIMSSGDIHWQRTPTPEEHAMPYVLAFDVRADYLAACSRVVLAWETPKPTGAIMFDPERAGFWRIDTNGAMWADPSKGVPIVNPIRIAADGSTHVTTPVLKYIAESGYPLPMVLDSVTAPGKSWILREWAEQIRDALPLWLTAGDLILRETLKATYAEAVGMMGKAGGLVDRNDWMWAIQDEARTGKLRKIDNVVVNAGHFPLKVHTDTVWYASPDNDVDRWLRLLGTDPEADPPRIGQFKLDKSKCSTMAEWLASQRPRPVTV